LDGLSFLDKKNVDSRAVFHQSQCRFLSTFSKIVLFIGEFKMKKLFYIILLFTIGLSAAEKKKLYVSKVIPQGNVPESISNTIVSRIKLVLLEKYQKDYQIVSDEDISVMYKKAAELQWTTPYFSDSKTKLFVLNTFFYNLLDLYSLN
jgi:hypothetical protein